VSTDENKWPLNNAYGNELGITIGVLLASAGDRVLCFWLPGEGVSVTGKVRRVASDNVIVESPEGRLGVIPIAKIEYITERSDTDHCVQVRRIVDAGVFCGQTCLAAYLAGDLAAPIVEDKAEASS
jgi:hypothetical protein